jgi:hypothetical protein
MPVSQIAFAQMPVSQITFARMPLIKMCTGQMNFGQFDQMHVVQMPIGEMPVKKCLSAESP